MVRAMKIKVINVTIFACLMAASGLSAEDAKTFKDDKEKANYAIGMSVGKQFQASKL